MARVWRDGQKGRVAVYRLITAGTVEESLLQRQVAKQQISTNIVDLGGTSATQTSFSQQELKNIFKLHSDAAESFGCWTHQLLSCDCHLAADASAVEEPVPVECPASRISANCQLGLKQVRRWTAMAMSTRVLQVGQNERHSNSIAQLNSWTHLVGEEEIAGKSTDALILGAASQISCVFMRTINACDEK